MPPVPRIAEHPPVRCPNCGVPLRLRETRMVGATFPCPECRELLVLLSATDGIELRRITELKTTPPQPPRSSRKAVQWRLPTLSPLIFAWSLAGMVALVLVCAVIRDHLAASHPARPVATKPPVENTPKPDEKSANTEVTEVAAADPVTPVEATNVAMPPPSAAPAVKVHVPSEPPQPPVSAASVLPVPAPVPAVAARPDARVLLAQKLTSFHQAKPASRRALLQTIEDLMDRPVRVADDVPADIVARLDHEIAINLENTTVGDVLAAILRDTGLKYECTADAVQLHRK